MKRLTKQRIKKQLREDELETQADDQDEDKQKQKNLMIGVHVD